MDEREGWDTSEPAHKIHNRGKVGLGFGELTKKMGSEQTFIKGGDDRTTASFILKS